MLSAFRSVGRAARGGQPLPDVDFLHDLYQEFGFRPRLGQVTLLAGQPKSGKSKFTMRWVSKMALPTVYFSADMAERTAMVNMLASLTNDSISEIEDGLEGAGEGYYADALRSVPIKISYNPNPTLDDIYGEIEAYVEWHDAWPQVIVVDNLLDVLVEGESELIAQRGILLELKNLARMTGAHIFVLHHMSESVGNPAFPSPRKALHNKVSQSPEGILSVARDGNEFRVSVVGSRNSDADPSGDRYITLTASWDYCSFERVYMDGGWWR